MSTPIPIPRNHRRSDPIAAFEGTGEPRYLPVPLLPPTAPDPTFDEPQQSIGSGDPLGQPRHRDREFPPTDQRRIEGSFAAIGTQVVPLEAPREQPDQGTAAREPEQQDGPGDVGRGRPRTRVEPVDDGGSKGAEEDVRGVEVPVEESVVVGERLQNGERTLAGRGGNVRRALDAPFEALP